MSVKIAHIVCVYPPYNSGIGNAARQFARETAKQDSGFLVRVFTPRFAGQPDIEKGNYSVKYLKPLVQRGNSAFIPSLYRELDGYDLIHFHYPFFGVHELLWLRTLLDKKQKLAIHFHMDVRHGSLINKIFSLPAGMVKKYLFGRADLITCASLDYVAHSSLKGFYVRHKRKFKELCFGVDTDLFSPTEKKNSVPQIVFVGGLDRAHYFKGLFLLFEALAGQKGPWNLKIVGSGDMMSIYRSKARRAGLNGRVEFLGSVADKELAEILKTSDIFVLPSINSNEAFGIVTIEAMASGAAVITSDLPGVRSVYRNGREGLSFKTGDPESLRSKLNELLADRIRRERMGRLGRELVMSKYNKYLVGRRLADLYRALL